jgi:cobaltochelatase CobS
MLADDLLAAIKSVKQIRITLPNLQQGNTLAESNIKAFQKIIDDVLFGHNVMLIGGAGTGKTYLAETVAFALDRGRQTINCSQYTSPLEILGGETLEGYKDGKLIEAWRNGEILILDEMPKLDPNTAGLLNEALSRTDKEGAVIQSPKGEKIRKHPNFGVIATGNVYPNNEDIAYAANNKQDLSLLDRFSGNVYFIEENPAMEQDTLQNNMIWSVANQLRQSIKENQFEAQISLRWMQNAARIYALEMQRVNKSEDVKANEGKTLLDCINGFIEPLNQEQQDVLYTSIKFLSNFANYQYRNFDKNKFLF